MTLQQLILALLALTVVVGCGKDGLISTGALPAGIAPADTQSSGDQSDDRDEDKDHENRDCSEAAMELLTVVESAKVSVSRVEVGSQVFALSPARDISVLGNMSGQVSALLSELNFAADPSVSQIRLIVSGTSLKLKDGGTPSLFVPSGTETGLKINVSPVLSLVSGPQKIALNIAAGCNLQDLGNGEWHFQPELDAAH
jgi:hypothetical protein